MNFETASSNVRTMDKAVKAATVPGQHNEEYVEAEVLPEKNKCS